MTITSATLHYFLIEGYPVTAGLGEHLNLFLKDSGINMEYIRHTHAEWPAIKEDLLKNKNVLHPTMPFVEINGKVFNKTAPTMRYLSKQLGKYQGSNDEENYQLDVVADIVRDHFASLVPLFFSKDEEKLKEHYENGTKKYLDAYNAIYGQLEGPYILGEQISYADFLVYHMLDDDLSTFVHAEVREKERLETVKDYPNVVKFIQAIKQRPNLNTYFASLESQK
ncbi:class gamma glutathione S-transferase 2 [Chlamydoabsidia padenii]|nr:class gamma glutathione S-transferase 2 [Chlamydoabsidia padenii]